MGKKKKKKESNPVPVVVDQLPPSQSIPLEKESCLDPFVLWWFGLEYKAMQDGYIHEKNCLYLTERGEEILSLDLRTEIKRILSMPEIMALHDPVPAVIVLLHDQIIEIANNKNCGVDSVIGTVKTYCLSDVAS